MTKEILVPLGPPVKSGLCGPSCKFFQGCPKLPVQIPLPDDSFFDAYVIGALCAITGRLANYTKPCPVRTTYISIPSKEEKTRFVGFLDCL
jgi:hypothetical protein